MRQQTITGGRQRQTVDQSPEQPESESGLREQAAAFAQVARECAAACQKNDTAELELARRRNSAGQ